MSSPSQRGRTPASSEGAAPKVEDDVSNTAMPGCGSVESVSHWTDSVESR